MRKRLIEQFNLRSRLKFNIDDGRIWLDESRMLLFHARALSTMRRELFEELGPVRARGVLLRMGFATGREDAVMARKLAGAGDDYDVFNIGPEMHAFEGIVKAVVTEADIDWESGSFYGTVELRGSWEAEAQIEHFGVGDECACWSIAGHASGYVSQFFQRFIVFREVRCVARGDECCVMHARPAEAWGDDPYLNGFKGADVDAPAAGGPTRPRAPPPLECASGRLVGRSAGFRTAFEKLGKAANSRINVLLLGETGVGKEMFARWLHENSDRAGGPFVAVNCGAIPHDLIESELFGVRRGAYTGAQESRPGRFERADGGTLLLDELGDLSPAAQVKLLRVLQTGEVERLGDSQVRKVDVRVVAATNVDLKQAIAQGRFRSDLYYRLSAYPVAIPPLRERKSDIPLLAAALIDKIAPAYDKKIKGLSDYALRALQDHAWPGNVRELENIIERGVLLAPEGGLIEAAHLFDEGAGDGTFGAPGAYGAQVGTCGHVGDMDGVRYDAFCLSLLDGPFDLEAHEEKLLRLAVDRAGGNLTHAARLLGVTRRQLAYRLRRGDAGGNGAGGSAGAGDATGDDAEE